MTKKTIEEQIANYISDRIIERLTGTTTEFDIIDVKPSRKFFIGTLLPPYLNKGENKGKSIVNPSAMSVEFLTDEIIQRIYVEIKFDIYYRIFPSFDQQKKRFSEVQGKDPLVKIFKRKTYQECIEFNGFNKEEYQKFKGKFNESFENFKNEILKDRDYFKNPGSSQLFNTYLDNANEYNKYLESRDGTPLKSNWNFDIEVICNSLEKKTYQNKVVLQNISEKGNDATFCNSSISIKLEKNPIKIKFGFIETEQNEVQAYVRGTGCVAKYLETENKIIAESLPIIKLFRTEPKSKINNTILSWKKLKEDSLPILEEVIKEMERFSNEKKGILKQKNDLFFEKKLNDFEEDMNNFIEGVKLISYNNQDNPVAKSFKLMNQVMDDCWEKKEYEGSWFIYQLVYIVSNIYRIVTKDEVDKVNVLRVPTGGGKTFCYIAIAIFTAFYERINNRLYGVTAWIKFPLRMLSLQQLQIIARYVCYANKIKKDNQLPGDDITLGYFVGGKNTPNTVKEGKEKLKNKDILPLLKSCPFCHFDVKFEVVNEGPGYIYHVCSNKNCKDGKKLPITIIDREIYRILPTFIISTLDKVVVFNFNYRGKGLLGGKIKACPYYGYNNGTWCLKGDEGARGYEPPSCKFYNSGICELKPLNGKGPTLIIQDELHMIREDHGCLDSLYESLLDHVAQELGKTRFKIFAATATISGVERQVEQLYQRGTRIFPTIFGENDFYFEKTNKLHRIIFGIMPHARAINWVVERVIAEYWRILNEMLRDISNLENKLGIDKVNLKKILVKNYTIMLSYHRSRREAFALPELTSKIGNDYLAEKQIDEILSKDIEIITSEKEMKDLHRLMSRVIEEDFDKKVKLIGATMAISHGIDFDELNMIVFQSMPRSISEYIQAMSRVGRKNPSLVFVVFHGNRIRDTSFYKYFYPIHNELDSLIETVPILRWARNAIHLTTPAAILCVLNTICSDKHGTDYFFVRNILKSMKLGDFSSQDISDNILKGFGIKRAPYQYKNDFELEIPETVNNLFRHLEKEANWNNSISNEIAQNYSNAILFGFRSKSNDVPICPTVDTGIIEEYMNDLLDKSGEIEDLNTPEEEQKDGLFDEEVEHAS